MSSAAHAELETSSRLAELNRVRTFVREFCSGLAGPAHDDEFICMLELAVNEAASNIMRHAYRGRDDATIRLVADAFDDRVSFRLFHHGESFDPSEVKPYVGRSEGGGLGLFILEKALDGVTYSSDADGTNCVHLVKKLKSAKGMACDESACGQSE